MSPVKCRPSCTPWRPASNVVGRGSGRMTPSAAGPRPSTTHLLLEPAEFLEKLVALTPRPRCICSSTPACSPRTLPGDHGSYASLGRPGEAVAEGLSVSPDLGGRPPYQARAASCSAPSDRTRWPARAGGGRLHLIPTISDPGSPSGSWPIWPGRRGLRRLPLPGLEGRLPTPPSSPSAHAGRALDADPTADPQSPCRCAGCPRSFLAISSPLSLGRHAR